ncbi:MAG: endonuclease [Flavobacteriales bacterium]|nr:endonuclease [Flavobacteriales bacterium]
MKEFSLGKKASLVVRNKANDLDPRLYRRITLSRNQVVTGNKVNTNKWFSNEAYREKGKSEIADFYEKISGESDLVPVEFLYKGSERAAAVCRIVVVGPRGGGYGSGFLVSGGYIMTNNHVLQSPELAASSYAEFHFEAKRDAVKVSFRPEKLFITDAELDFTIVACDLDELSDITPIPLSEEPAVVAQKERVSIIQHPRGRHKEVALQENRVKHVYDTVVWYNTDTEPGSSGSPTFNQQWDLVALHHAGWYEDQKTGEATNEGVLIPAIIRRLKQMAFSSSPFRVHAKKLLGEMESTGSVLGFFDVHGLVRYEESSLEVEIPTYQGDRRFADICFWNVEHFNNTVTDARVEAVARVVAELSMDVFGLVEVEHGALDRLKSALTRRGLTYDHVLLDARGSQDLAVLFDDETTKVKVRADINERYRELLSQRTARGNTAFPSGREPFFVECTVDEGDNAVTFLMVVVHLKAFGDVESRARRTLASNILAAIISDLRERENIPIVLGGDLNQTLRDDSVLNALLNAPDLFTLTLDDDANDAISYVGARNKSLIDHIIVSKDVQLGDISGDDAGIVRLDRSVKDFVSDVSDHVPLVCRLIYKKADGAKVDGALDDKHLSDHASAALNNDYQTAMLTATLVRTTGLPYYDEQADVQAVREYYRGIRANEPAKALFLKLSDLLERTHHTTPNYNSVRNRHLYPVVDLHPDGKLRSIYRGDTSVGYDPEVFIEHDYGVEREIERKFELWRNSESFSLESEADVLDRLEAAAPYNCEHVVCQSWFGKVEPMRGDMHHLFACESGCNSSRGNKPYIDFEDYNPDGLEAIRLACGKGEGNRFEPEAGKGPVARATLYYLLRYPESIGAYSQEDLKMLLDWHERYKVGLYELHRNQCIHRVQGNRNPLIDKPEIARRIAFELGLR